MVYPFFSSNGWQVAVYFLPEATNMGAILSHVSLMVWASHNAYYVYVHKGLVCVRMSLTR